MPVFNQFKKKAFADEEEKPEVEQESEDVEEVEVEEAAEEEVEEADETPLPLPSVPSDWAERLQVTAVAPLKKGDWNFDDDALREELFEKQAMANVEQAMHLLKQHKVPLSRPGDFYAEMVKSDVHMAKIRENMEYEKGRIEASALRKKQKHAAKFGKQVQQKVEQDRQEKKSQAMARIEHLKKKSKKFGLGAADKDEVHAALGDEGPPEARAGQKRTRSLTPGGGAKRAKAAPAKRPGKARRNK
eukprot:TRINITY_DN32106_c0_g1_i1.p2 TRINITY_DN32106_c0_g1~~TRINITY_DN32106_c0_g1_i1.p2  ORF type:complete len:261 (+),score=141.94 TRINITY_DN32106_c0_g1_i1:50-784(+)